jgi:hypothetical protein
VVIPSNVNDIETKGQTFRYRSLLSERKQNILVWSATIGTKAKHIDLVQRIFYCEQIVSVLAQKFWDEAKQFDLAWKWFGQSRTFIFNPKTNRLKQKVLIWFPYYWNESRTF